MDEDWGIERIDDLIEFPIRFAEHELWIHREQEKSLTFFEEVFFLQSFDFSELWAENWRKKIFSHVIWFFSH